MKIKIFVFIAVAMLVSGLSWVVPFVGHKGDALPGMTAYASSYEIQVTLNGQPVLFDVQPQYSGERIYVPFRKLLEALGAAVEWDQEQKVATATKDGLAVKIPLGSEKIYMQEHALQMDVPVIMIDDRTLVPLRFAAQALGARVDWTKDAGGERIVITQSYDVMIDRLVNGKTAAGDMKVNYEQAAILFEWLERGFKEGKTPPFTGINVPEGKTWNYLYDFNNEVWDIWNSLYKEYGNDLKIEEAAYVKSKDFRFQKHEWKDGDKILFVGYSAFDTTRNKVLGFPPYEGVEVAHYLP